MKMYAIFCGEGTCSCKIIDYICELVCAYAYVCVRDHKQLTMKRIIVFLFTTFFSVAACSNLTIGGGSVNSDSTGTGNEQAPGTDGTETPEYDIYLLIGQSNAAGRGVMKPGDEQPIEGVKMIWSIPYGPCVVQDACQPLNLNSTVRKGKAMQKFNLAGPFAAKLHRETGRQILLIVNARGETSLGNWLPNAGQLTYAEKTGDDQDKWGSPIPQLYGEAVRIVKQVLSQEDIKGELKGILWHQGCGNSNETESPLYCSRLKAVVDGLRTEFNNPNLPFVAGQLVPEFKNAQYFNPEIVKIGDVITNAFCATSEDCESVGDGTHFNRESLIIMGERYADIILREVYGK